MNIEDLAAPFVIDLDRQRRDGRVDGAANVPDHPLLHIPDIINVKATRSDGRYDITCPWVDEHTNSADDGAAIFTNQDGTIGFKCHHGNCESRTVKDLVGVVELVRPGFGDVIAYWKMKRVFADVATPVSFIEPHKIESVKTGLTTLLSLCANGESEIMRTQMLEDIYVLKNVAILGQWTVFFAGPNTGKTLIVIWLLLESIKSGQINADDIFYANCDDTYKGGVEKLELAEKYGFNMLIPNINGFKPEALVSAMKLMCVENHAKGKIIVFDTLKKFTDLMDKKLSTEFGKLAREFIAAGGTVICLAHVNKNKGANGKSIRRQLTWPTSDN